MSIHFSVTASNGTVIKYCAVFHAGVEYDNISAAKTIVKRNEYSSESKVVPENYIMCHGRFSYVI